MKTPRISAVILTTVALLGGFAFDVVPKAGAVPAPAASLETSEFVGIWKVQDGRQQTFYITLSADGSAASAWVEPQLASRGQTGTWKLVDGVATIIWDNGWRETISAKEDGGFTKRAFNPRASLDGEPTNESPAEKVDAIPAA